MTSREEYPDLSEEITKEYFRSRPEADPLRATDGSYHLELGKIVDYIGRSLNAEERTEVERHILVCDVCLEELGVLAKIDARIRSAKRMVDKE